MPLPQNRNKEAAGGMIPPPGIPVRRFTTPSIGHAFYTERVDVSARDYIPLGRGTLYATIKNAQQKVIDQFPTLYFLKETLDPFYYPWALRLWTTDEDAESTYNAEVSYINENVDYPAYSRPYTLRREEYEASPSIEPGTPLTGVTGVRVNSGGAGYTKDDTVVFSSGDAKAVLVVDGDGSIINVIVTNEGTGYDSDSPPTVTIISATSTSDASLTALMQDKTAVLTSQKKIEIPDDDPASQEWVKVIRVYETLPGPFEYDTRLDPDGVVVGIATRRNIAANIESGEGVVGDIWTKRTKKADQNSYVADEIVETRALPGNAIPSVLVGQDLYGAYTYRTLYYGDYITPEVSESGGVITTVEKKEVTEAVADKIITNRKWVDEADFVLMIPVFYRNAHLQSRVPTRTITHKVKGVASQPTSLGLGEFSRAEKQLDAVFKNVTVEFLEFDQLPLVLTGLKETNDKKQVVDVVITVELDSATPTLPNEVRDIEFFTLGNGLAVEVARIVPRVFPEDSYTKSILNLIPEKFRGQIPTVETTIDEVGQPSTDPTLLTGEFSRTEGRLTEFTKRTRITSLGSISLPVILLGNKETDSKKQVVSVVYTLEDDGTTPTVPTALRDVEFVKLGNGLAVETVRTVPEVFPEDSYSKTIANLIPEKFKASIPLIETTIDEIGNPSTDPTLLDGEFSRTEGRVTEFTRRVRITKLDVDVLAARLPIILIGDKETDKNKQVVSVTYTLEADTTTPTAPNEVRDVEFVKLGGNGLAVETVRTVPEVFPEDSYTTSILDRIPEPLKTVLWMNDNVIDEIGVPSTSPVLLTGEFSRAEGRLTEFTKRTRIIRIEPDNSVPSFALDYGTTEQFGGATTVISHSFNVSGTYSVEQGLMVVNSKLIDLGNGYEVLSSEKADGAEWTELYGQDYDEGLDVTIPFTEQTVDAGPGSLGGSKTDIKPEDIWRSKKRAIDISAAESVLGEYLMQYPSKINLSMPDKLVSITSQIESQTGAGADQEVGSIGTPFGSYSITLDLRADATASATIMPEVVAIIKQFYGANIDATHYVFFLPNPVTSADVVAKINALIADTVAAWPKFNPQTITMLIVGANAALKVNAVSKGSYSQSADLSSQSSTAGGGTGYSRAKGLTLRRMEISPTIHGSLSVGGVTTDSVDLNAYCQSEAVGLGPLEAINETDSINAFTSPTSFDPTDGDTDWPSSGKYLYRVDGRPYKYGFVMFHAIVVDAADFPSS